MMKRVDDFVKSKEAYKSTELSKGEHPEKVQAIPLRGGIPSRPGHGSGHKRMDNYGRCDHYQPYVPPRAPDQRNDDHQYDNRIYDNRRQETGMMELRAVSSIVHAMVKFPTLKGIATLITQTEPVYECRWSERQVVENDKGHETTTSREPKGPEEEVLVNPAHSEQRIMIGI
ncbi:hypothetical protein Tco_1146267 [Tanacetum coccineum]